MWMFVALLACEETTKEAPAEKPEVAQVAPKEEVKEKLESFEQYGADFTISDSMTAKELLNSPEKYVGKKVRVSAKVSDVCQKMGCWMVISEEDKHMRVTTKDHKFFVAKDGAGSKCDIEGEVVLKKASKARSEHFASEQSEGAPVPEGEKTNSATYEIVAAAIRLKVDSDPNTGKKESK